MDTTLPPFMPPYQAAPVVSPARSALVQAIIGRTPPPAPPANYSSAFQLSPTTLMALKEMAAKPGPADAPQTNGQVAQGMVAAGATPQQAKQVADAYGGDYAAGYTQPPPMGMGAQLLGFLGLGPSSSTPGN